MTALLTDNLPLLASAPNGIKKLRELILELAVRGKLVPQNPSDEPASELLKRIAEEKARLVAEGKIKKLKPLAESAEGEKPFGLPEGWSWTSLNEIAAMRGGSTPSMSKSEFWNGDIPWVSPKDMHDGDITDSELKVTQLALDKTSLELVPIGSILLVGRSGILKRKLPAQITAVPCTINQDLKAISPFQPQPSNYVQLMLRGTERVILKEDVKQGTTVQSLVYDKLFVRPFGLPPLAEQHRIVAKVDELMALCDRLEAQQADAESAHAQLVQALLDSLTQASDAADFAANWQRLAEHFHTLLTTEPSIDALKQTLLQLAVMGKLVPQDPSDEPASELLRRITEKKARLVAEGKAKKQTLLADSVEENKLFDVPEAWEWCRVSDLISIKHGYAFSSAYFSESASPYVLTTPGSLFEAGGFRDRGDRTKYYCGPVDQEFALHAGDLIVAMTEQAAGLLGSTAFVPNDGKIYLHNQRLGKLIFDSGTVSSGYIFHYFNGVYLRSCVADSSTGMKVKHTSPGKIGAVFFPLPPLAEQHRIVAKVDQLMALCDQLKPRLTQARQLNEQLASTLVEQAVA
ncbi:restriction endonuclease subunit S [Pseudomonas sp. NPDC077408]